MSKCRNCGRDLSLFERIISFNSKLCGECKHQKKVNIEQFKTKLNIFGADNYLDENEMKDLLRLKEELKLTDEDIKPLKKEMTDLIVATKMVKIKIYHNKLSEFHKNGYLTDENIKELSNIRETYALTDEDISGTKDLFNHLKRITDIKQGKLTILKDFSLIILKSGELCHFFFPVDLIEEKHKTHYVGGSSGVSMKIAKGFYYRVGAFRGDPDTEIYHIKTDYGPLCITNKRVVFSGTNKNITYPLDKLGVNPNGWTVR